MTPSGSSLVQAHRLASIPPSSPGLEARKADGKAIAIDSMKKKEALRATAEPPAHEDGKGKVPIVPRARSPPGSDAAAETKAAITSTPAGRCSAPTSGAAVPKGGDRSSQDAGAWRPPAWQGPSEDDARVGEQQQGHTTQRCSRAMSRDGWCGTLASGVPLPPPSTISQAAAGELGWNGWSPSGAGELEQCLYLQKECGYGRATVPSLGERLATAGMIFHVPSSLL